jgi:hypothetical protein
MGSDAIKKAEAEKVEEQGSGMQWLFVVLFHTTMACILLFAIKEFYYDTASQKQGGEFIEFLTSGRIFTGLFDGTVWNWLFAPDPPPTPVKM